MNDAGGVNELLKAAVKEIRHLKEGEVFLLKDLFKGYIWNRIPVPERLLLGTLFLNYAHKAEGEIEIMEKTSSHQQRYRKCLAEKES